MLQVKVKKISKDAVIPTKINKWDAGYDLYSIEECRIDPGERRLIRTGLEVELPYNTEAQIRPRSGLALHYGITVLNTPGTVDSPYRGEIGVILINFGQESYHVKKGERIAQMIVKYIEQIHFVECDMLSETDRGDTGFGASDK